MRVAVVRLAPAVWQRLIVAPVAGCALRAAGCGLPAAALFVDFVGGQQNIDRRVEADAPRRGKVQRNFGWIDP